MAVIGEIEREKTGQDELSSPAWPLVFQQGVLAVRADVLKWAKADASRLVLWAPAAIGVGAGLYFGFKTEPAFWIAPLVLVVFLAAFTATDMFPRIFGTFLLVAIGFCAADLRTFIVDAPMLERELTPRLLTGRLISIGEGAAGRRLVIAVESVDRLAGDETPERVRINWRGKEFAALPGDQVSIRAGLSPPPPPVAPGAFDFARHLFFQRIGAVGYAVTPPLVLDAEKPSLSAVVQAKVESMRFNLSRRIVEAAPGEGGAIVAAFVTGKRDAINDRSDKALRDSGLAHLLAISGLHMGLATGLIFFAVRGLLALWEPVALKYPIKKWAAGCALGAGLFYLLLSGGGWSARRAFIMASIIFIAILVDRRALSLRNVAIAACLILLLTPEALLHPGFQMSFAAVTALIAAYEWVAGRVDPNRSFSWIAKFKRYAIGIGVTDTIAAVATAPFALYHFNRVAIYSLPANMAAMPLMAFWIMPAAVLALFLTPFGLDAWAWRLSAAGVDAVLAAATWVSSKPGAISLTVQWPLAALLLLTVGGLWLCLMSARWRYAGLAAIPITAIIVANTSPPDIFVARSGENAAVIVDNEEGVPTLAVFNKRKNRFDARAWREYAGLDGETGKVLAMKDIGACDRLGCVATVKDQLVAISQDPIGFFDDCNRADLVIALYPVAKTAFEGCKAELIDRRAVWDLGAHAIMLNEGEGMVTKTVNAQRGERPWTE